jgi:hypothetical protein
MTPTPEPPSLADRAIETELVYQLPEQEALSHVIVVTGAVPSGVTVKLVGLDVRPAPFVAVTSFGSTGSVAPAPKV